MAHLLNGIKCFCLIFFYLLHFVSDLLDKLHFVSDFSRVFFIWEFVMFVIPIKYLVLLSRFSVSLAELISLFLDSHLVAPQHIHFVLNQQVLPPTRWKLVVLLLGSTGVWFKLEHLKNILKLVSFGLKLQTLLLKKLFPTERCFFVGFVHYQNAQFTARRRRCAAVPGVTAAAAEHRRVGGAYGYRRSCCHLTGPLAAEFRIHIHWIRIRQKNPDPDPSSF